MREVMGDITKIDHGYIMHQVNMIFVMNIRQRKIDLAQFKKFQLTHNLKSLIVLLNLLMVIVRKQASNIQMKNN